MYIEKHIGLLNDRIWSLTPVYCFCFPVGTMHGRSLLFPNPVFRWGPHIVAQFYFLIPFSCQDCTWSLATVSCFLFSYGDCTWSLAPISCFLFSCGDRTWSLIPFFVLVFQRGLHMVVHSRFLFQFSSGDCTRFLARISSSCFYCGLHMVTRSRFLCTFFGGDNHHSFMFVPLVGHARYPTGILVSN